MGLELEVINVHRHLLEPVRGRREVGLAVRRPSALLYLVPHHLGLYWNSNCELRIWNEIGIGMANGFGIGSYRCTPSASRTSAWPSGSWARGTTSCRSLVSRAALSGIIIGFQIVNCDLDLGLELELLMISHRRCSATNYVYVGGCPVNQTTYRIFIEHVEPHSLVIDTHRTRMYASRIWRWHCI